MSEVPEGFGERGARLWREMNEFGELSPVQRVLTEEACRIVDRLESLDAYLSGRSTSWLTLNLDDTEVKVVVDQALAEARQQVTALKGISAELRQLSQGRSSTGPVGTASGVSDLTARIAGRRAQAAD